jgi:spore cortex formation protein SpoVR/YcgB (stage V sporulation)
MNADDIQKLEYAIAEITEIANGFGLDYYPMRYEICPADIIYTFGAYGMPTRFSHWSFGKTFNKMKMQYDFGLSKIYELVINSDPCYAFLLDGNSLIQNKLIVAHVLASPKRTATWSRACQPQPSVSASMKYYTAQMRSRSSSMPCLRFRSILIRLLQSLTERNDMEEIWKNRERPKL